MRIAHMQFEGEEERAVAPSWIAAHQLGAGYAPVPRVHPGNSTSARQRRVRSLVINIERLHPASRNQVRLQFDGGFSLQFQVPDQRDSRNGHDGPAGFVPPLDHVTVCVYLRNLDTCADRLCALLPAAHCEYHEVGTRDCGMRIAAVSDRQSGMQVVFAAPTGPYGQVAEFLARTGCEGLQHVAFSVDCVRETLSALRSRGLEFVGGSAANPDQAVIELREQDSWLRQAFTTPIWGEFFIEIIERNGITGLHPGNIQSLYDMNERAASNFSDAPVLRASG